MAPFKKRSYRKKPATKKAFVKKAVSRAKTQRLTKFIKKVMTRTEEKKMSESSDILSLAAYTSPNLPNQILPISPSDSSGIVIPQGTGQGERIGNRIRTHSCMLRGIIYPQPYDATLNPVPSPQEIRVWFFSKKFTSETPTTLPNFFQSANSSSAPVGTLIDLTRKINTDVYTYLGHRTWKLGFQVYGGSGNTIQQQYYNNNDFKYNIKYTINLTKMIPKLIKFNDTDNQPTSKSVFMFWESVNANGFTQTTTTIPAEMQYTLDYTYTDN